MQFVGYWLLGLSVLVQPSLLDAVRDGNEPQIEVLLSVGTDLEVTDELGRTPLLIAAGSGRLGVVSKLIEAGANVAAQDDEGIDALTLAKASGHADVVERLRAAGASERLEELLAGAIRDGELDAVSSLIDQGVNVDALDTEDYQTPLMAAVQMRRLEILLRLIEAGADPTIEGTGIGTTGENAITLAARQASPWALRVLIEARARQRDKDRALLLGCHVRAIVDVALELGAAVDARDATGQTSLICAAAKGAVDAMRSLLSAGAKRDPVDRDGRSALDWAKRNGHREAQALLSR